MVAFLWTRRLYHVNMFRKFLISFMENHAFAHIPLYVLEGWVIKDKVINAIHFLRCGHFSDDPYLVSTKRLDNIYATSVQRLRCWSNII